MEREQYDSLLDISRGFLDCASIGRIEVDEVMTDVFDDDFQKNSDADLCRSSLFGFCVRPSFIVLALHNGRNYHRMHQANLIDALRLDRQKSYRDDVIARRLPDATCASDVKPDVKKRPKAERCRRQSGFACGAARPVGLRRAVLDGTDANGGERRFASKTLLESRQAQWPLTVILNIGRARARETGVGAGEKKLDNGWAAPVQVRKSKAAMQGSIGDRAINFPLFLALSFLPILKDFVELEIDFG
ncbi:hypothetical protein DFH07DRAFT_944979 [Mycena maculata]|uniref:Uncharacterized protein n=1 Tax=Mycena maculata TaxID=230809 RepID=A0AAD7MU02_9AGAR|nr:hypothetical protein DFH07DRAFT_944979 [Mycena maculata]